MKEKEDKTVSSYNETIASKLEPVMLAGQRVESDLQERMGKTIRKAILFPNTDMVVAEAGETITSQHIANVQEIVKERLEDLENEIKDQRQRELEHIKLDIARLKAEDDQAIIELRNQLEDEMVAVRREYNRLREELLDLQPLTFMGEMRYRELKSRWGQVFRADMGAEAFYDILRRLDLDALAKELWHELRTSRSKQKRRNTNRRTRKKINLHEKRKPSQRR